MFDMTKFDITKLLGLDKFEKVLSRIESLPIALIPERCTKRRSHLFSCRECQRVCPVEAIDLTADVKVDFEKCIACGLCATICPTGVFQLKPSDMRLMGEIKAVLDSQSGADKSICFGCIDQGDVPFGVKVNCLGRLNEALLMASAFFGAQTIFLLSDDCAECEISCGKSEIANIVKTTESLLVAYSMATKIIYTEEPPMALDVSPQVELDHIERRDFLQYAKKNVMAVGSEFFADKLASFSQEVEEIGFKYILPENRKLLLTVLRKIDQTAPPAQSNTSGTPFANIDINDKCFFCRQCQLFCPTGALSVKTGDDGVASINLSLANCTKCGLCEAICPTESISFSDDVDLLKVLNDEPEELVALELRECKVCKQQFGAKGDVKTCGYCLKRQEKTGDQSWVSNK